MARVAASLSCSSEVLVELERLSRSRSVEVRLAKRARVVLACLYGERNGKVARESGLQPDTVGGRSQRCVRGSPGQRPPPQMQFATTQCCQAHRVE